MRQADLETRVQRLEAELLRTDRDLEPARNHASAARWPVAAAVAGTMVLLSLLLFCRTPATEVELAVVASGLQFVSPEAQSLEGVRQLASLGVTGAERIDLPRHRDGESRTLTRSGRQALSIRLSLPPGEDGAGGISLADMVVAAGARARLRLEGGPGRHNLSFDREPVEVAAVVSGPVILAAPAEGVRTLDFGAGGRLEVRGTALSLDLELPAGELRRRYAEQFDVESLVFSRVDEHETTRGTRARRVSTIESGRLFLEELDGRAVELRHGERLRFARSEGWIRELTLRDGLFYLTFRGRVEGMRTGTEDNPRSLMPSWLEWITARRPAALLWGATLYLSGLVLGLLRWLGVAS